MSNEKLIREAVKSFLSKKYNNLAIKEEFGVFLDSRNDVMGVSHDNIISIEIKSNKDTFLRLEKQLTTYQTFSTIVYVAIDEIHLNKYQRIFSELFNNVGILVYKENRLFLIKEPKITEFKMLYSLLTSRELTLFFAHFKGKSLIPKDYKTSMFLIENIFTQEEIFRMSKYIFVTRFLRNEPQYVPKELFDNYDVSQQKFKNWLKEENWNIYVPFVWNTWCNVVKKPKAKRIHLKCVKQNIPHS